MDTQEQWVQLYREGYGAAEVADQCGEPDTLAVLRHLSEAKRSDPALENEHRANWSARVREVQEEVAAKRAFTPAWQSRLEDLAVFVKEHSRMPRQAGGDAEETSVGRWLHAQRAKVAKGTLNPRQRAALDAIGNWDSDTRVRREGFKFPDFLRSLIAFKAEHGRWPSYVNGTPADERALGVWLHTTRLAASEGRLPDAARRALDAKAPGWNPWQTR